MRSAPCSSVPVGSVPGIRLDKAQNAVRSPPGGNRNGQATNPGRSGRLGLSARQATSVPETTDWRKKLRASDASEASLTRNPFGGRKRKLVHVAPATAARPTGRSAGAHPEIMSQKARKSAARPAAARARPGAASSAAALNGPIRRAKPARLASGPAIARRPARGKSGQAHRSSGSASEISIPALRSAAALPCSIQGGKHRRPLERAAKSKVGSVVRARDNPGRVLAAARRIM